MRHLIIADTALRGDDLHWVHAVCRQLDVSVHRYIERLVPADPLIEQLRTAPDLAASWNVMGDLFKAVALDACVLALTGSRPAEMGEVPTWRRMSGPDASMPAGLALYARTGTTTCGDRPHLNGRRSGAGERRGWRVLAPVPSSGRLIAAPSAAERVGGPPRRACRKRLVRRRNGATPSATEFGRHASAGRPQRRDGLGGITRLSNTDQSDT